MTSKLILLMQRYRGWRVIAVTGIVILLAVELTASAVEYGINGVVHADTWVIALVVAGIVAPLSLGFLAEVLNEIAKAQQHSLEASVRRAETRLEMAIEAAQMVFWELDFVTGELRYNDAKEHWLGVDSLGEAHTIPSWMNNIHPDDQAPFMEHFQRALLPDNAGFDFEYRVKKIGGGWIWVQSRGNVVQRGANNEPLLAAGGSLNIDARKMADSPLVTSMIDFRISSMITPT